MKREPTPPAHCTFEPEDWLRLAKCWHPVARACDVGPAPVKATLLDEQLVIYRINDRSWLPATCARTAACR